MSARVLFLVQNMSYPRDRRVRLEAVALARRGFEVTVVSPTGIGEDEPETHVEGVRVLRFRPRPSRGGAVGYLVEYVDAAIKIRRIIRRLRREEPFAVVVAANPPDFLIHLARPLRRRGAGLVFDYHDPAPELFESMFGRTGLLHRLLLVAERAAEKTADLVLTVNEPCAELVRTRGGVAADRVYVVYNGPDPASFYEVGPRPELRAGRSQLVLWIGQMSRKERLDLLVDAADRLVNQAGRNDVAFAIVGDGESRATVRALVEERGLQDIVLLPGSAGDDLLRAYLSTASVCVSLDEHSELNDRSLMIKVLEYMIMGRAIVQFPLHEIKRICGDTTLYAENGNAADLADRIGLLLDDPARRRKLGEAARGRVLDGLTWPDQVPTLVAAVERAADIAEQRMAARSGQIPASQP